ncbi:MAG: ATP-binding protein [Deltaproteobacteria bacterium]|nr:ATP-binding protein [Deltaproteobacteria bacterium]
MKLYHREILEDIRPHYYNPDVLVIHGARQVGKTCLMTLIRKELQASGVRTHYIDLEDMRLLAVLNEGPQALLGYLEESGLLQDGKLYLFLDEIQYVTAPSPLLKLLRDHHADRLKLIVSGSSSFEIKSKFTDSLAGRTVNFELLPLSFREFLRFKGSNILLDKPVKSLPLVREIETLFNEFVLYGGYPRVALEKTIKAREVYLSQVINTYIRKDIRDLANIRHIQKFNRLLETLAAQCGQLLNITELANTAGISRSTVENYLFILEQTYVIQLLRPFSRNIRAELFKTPKVFFHDTGIAHLLWLKAFPKTILGSMLENAVFAELRKNREVDEFFFWRTQDGKEIDFIVPKGDSILPVEVKTSASKIRRGALRYFSGRYTVSKAVCFALHGTGQTDDLLEVRYPWERIL